MSEQNKILEQYMTLIGAMEQLEKEVPLIEQEYQKFKNSIKEQAAIAEKSISSIGNKTDIAMKRFQEFKVESNNLLKKQEDNMKLINTSMVTLQSILRQADDKINTLMELINAQTNAEFSKIELKLAALEKKINAAGTLGTAVNSIPPVQNNSWKPSKKIFSSKEHFFKSDAIHFTFDDQKSVKYKKPYGIVIEGEIIMAEHWTNLLIGVVEYAFENFGAIKEELCTDKYGIVYQGIEEVVTIPYFVDGYVEYIDGNSYKYIESIDISVFYSGADKVVEVLNVLLCDYLKIKPRNVELFYHNK